MALEIDLSNAGGLTFSTLIPGAALMLKGFRNSGKLFVISVATCLHSAMITIKRVTNDHDGDGDGDGDHDGD